MSLEFKIELGLRETRIGDVITTCVGIPLTDDAPRSTGALSPLHGRELKEQAKKSTCLQDETAWKDPCRMLGYGKNNIEIYLAMSKNTDISLVPEVSFHF